MENFWKKLKEKKIEKKEIFEWDIQINLNYFEINLKKMDLSDKKEGF